MKLTNLVALSSVGTFILGSEGALALSLHQPKEPSESPQQSSDSAISESFLNTEVTLDER